MVLLHGSGGQALGVTIKGYLHPGITTWDDANWLDVRFDVRHPRGDWSFTPERMNSVDARSLVRWLEDVAAGRVGEVWVTDEMHFMLAVVHAPDPY